MTLIDTSHEDEDININVRVAQVISMKNLKPMLPKVNPKLQAV